MACTDFSVSSVDRGTLTMISSQSGSKERMDGTKGYPSAQPFRMKVNPLIFT